jgi:hypothetical protein
MQWIIVTYVELNPWVMFKMCLKFYNKSLHYNLYCTNKAFWLSDKFNSFKSKVEFWERCKIQKMNGNIRICYGRCSHIHLPPSELVFWCQKEKCFNANLYWTILPQIFHTKTIVQYIYCKVRNPKRSILRLQILREI